VHTLSTHTDYAELVNPLLERVSACKRAKIALVFCASSNNALAREIGEELRRRLLRSDDDDDDDDRLRARQLNACAGVTVIVHAGGNVWRVVFTDVGETLRVLGAIVVEERVHTASGGRRTRLGASAVDAFTSVSLALGRTGQRRLADGGRSGESLSDVLDVMCDVVRVVLSWVREEAGGSGLYRDVASGQERVWKR
jgi:hypothetical protein